MTAPILRGITSFAPTLLLNNIQVGTTELGFNFILGSTNGSYIQFFHSTANVAPIVITFFDQFNLAGSLTIDSSGFSFNSPIRQTGQFVVDDGGLVSEPTGAGQSAKTGNLQLWSSNGGSPAVSFNETAAGNRGTLGYQIGSSDLLYVQGAASLSTSVGVEQFRVVSSPGSNATCLTIQTNTSSAGLSNHPITLGAKDSGGAGFRVLIVPN